jgi:hypothetical protein
MHKLQQGKTMSASKEGNTFSAIALEPEVSADQNFGDFVNTLLKKLDDLRQERFTYYDNLRRSNARWANESRLFLSALGAVAFLLTGLAAALRFVEPTGPGWWIGSDKWVLLAVLAIYAIMGAISFYEKGTDKTGTYFRHVASILAIRDLWTKLQFEILKELTAVKGSADPKAEIVAREHIRALADAFCMDLNKATSGEVGEWKTAFLASLSAIDAAAKKGADDATKQLQEIIKGAEKAAADAKAAAKTAEDAARLGAVNIALIGDFDDEVIISVDGVEVARTRNKTAALDRVRPGLRKFFARSKKAGKEIETSLMVEVKPALQELKLSLS